MLIKMAFQSRTSRFKLGNLSALLFKNGSVCLINLISYINTGVNNPLAQPCITNPI